MFLLGAIKTGNPNIWLEQRMLCVNQTCPPIGNR